MAATKPPPAVVNSTLMPTCEQRRVSRSRMCSGKTARHLQGATKSTSTTTRSTRSDAARTPRNSRSSSTKAATCENTTANSPLVTPSCSWRNSTCPHLRSGPPSDANSKPNCVQQAWTCLNRRLPSPRWRNTARLKLRRLRLSDWPKLRLRENMRCSKPKKPLNVPCRSFKHVWNAKALNPRTYKSR